MATYRGRRTTDEGAVSEVEVIVGARELTPQASLRVRNHSPMGFSWGYAGSGPAQLALAILLDYFLHQPAHAVRTSAGELALRHYQSFKAHFVARWGEQWELTDEQIRTWLMTEAPAAPPDCPLNPGCCDGE